MDCFFARQPRASGDTVVGVALLRRRACSCNPTKAGWKAGLQPGLAARLGCAAEVAVKEGDGLCPGVAGCDGIITGSGVVVERVICVLVDVDCVTLLTFRQSCHQLR